MKYDKINSFSKELSSIQKTLDSYKGFTQAFTKRSNFYAKTIPHSALAASLNAKKFVPKPTMVDAIASKVKYTAALNVKVMGLSMDNSALASAIKLSSCIKDSYLNGPAVSGVCKSIQKLQNTYTSSLQQQATELIITSKEILSAFESSSDFDVDQFEFDQDTVSAPISFVDSISDIFDNTPSISDILLPIKEKISIKLFISIVTTIISAITVCYLITQNKLQAESNQISKEQLQLDKKYKKLEFEQKERELDQKDRELDLKDEELHLNLNKSDSNN